MATWSRNPELAKALQDLPLTAEEGFVISRLDVPLTRDQLVELTALAPARVDYILALLEDKGIVMSDEPSMRPSQHTIPDMDLAEPERAEDFDDDAPTLSRPAPKTAPVEFSPVGPLTPAEPPEPPTSEAQDEEDDEPPPAEPSMSGASVDRLPSAILAPDLDPNILEPRYQHIYDRRLRQLPPEMRIGLAGRETRDMLFALCLDQEPAVIRAVLMNPECARSHARVIALNHTDPSGLEILASTRDLLSDAQVEWLLLRNPQISEALATHILQSKRFADAYEVWNDSVVPEQVRAIAREQVRVRFGKASAEKRASFINSTEGNVLGALMGVALDGRTTALLSQRQYTSAVFVRNLLKFNACPGPLLVHLSKQQFVKRNPQLRNMLLQHPNLPGDAKRRV